MARISSFGSASAGWPDSSTSRKRNPQNAGTLGIELNNFAALLVLFRLSAPMPSKNERVEFEMKIMKARQLARDADDKTRERLKALAAELEKKLREIDE
jgi:hypothetical protein